MFRAPWSSWPTWSALWVIGSIALPNSVPLPEPWCLQPPVGHLSNVAYVSLVFLFFVFWPALTTVTYFLHQVTCFLYPSIDQDRLGCPPVTVSRSHWLMTTDVDFWLTKVHWGSTTLQGSSPPQSNKGLHFISIFWLHHLNRSPLQSPWGGEN